MGKKNGKRHLKETLFKEIETLLKSNAKPCEKWNILSASMFKQIPGDESVSCMLSAFPKNEIKNWNNLTEEQRKVKATITVKASILPYLIYGRDWYFDEKGKIHSDSNTSEKNDSEELIIPFDFTYDEQEAKSLFKIIKEEHQNFFPFFENLK